MKENQKHLKFDCFIKAASEEQSKELIAKASVSTLKEFLPNISEDNIDLLPVVMDSCVVNTFNKNGHGIDSSVASEIYKNFANKPINIEHETQKIIGTILSAQFTDMDHKVIDPEVAKTKKDPYYITLSGVIWRRVNEAMASFIEDCSDSSSPNFNEVSASWELIHVDSKLMATEKESSLMEDYEELEEHDMIEASRKYPGKTIRTKIIGWALPIGLGIVERPAANVKGIATPKTANEEPPKEKDRFEEMLDTMAASLTTFAKAIESDNKALALLISQMEKRDVITEKSSTLNNITMKLSNKKDITDELLLAGTIKASTIVDFVQDIEQMNEKFIKEKSDLENQSKLAAEKAETLANDLKASREELEKIRTELAEVKSKIESEEKHKAFVARMAYFSETYNLSTDAQKIISKELTSISTDAEFEEFKTKMEAFLVKKSTASSQDPIDDALKGKKVTPTIPNTSLTNEKKDEFAKAFALDQFEIKIK